MAAKTKEEQFPQEAPRPLRGWAKLFGFAPDGRSYGKYIAHPSPDRAHRVVFEPGIEYAMMRYAHQFRLVDGRRTVVQPFRGLEAPMQMAWWTPDSRIVAVPIDNGKGGLLLYEVKRRRFSLVLMSPHQQNPALTRTTLAVSVDEPQYHMLFGDEVGVTPPCLFRLSALSWFPAPAEGPWKLREAFRAAPDAPWLPAPAIVRRALGQEPPKRRKK